MAFFRSPVYRSSPDSGGDRSGQVVLVGSFLSLGLIPQPKSPAQCPEYISSPDPGGVRSGQVLFHHYVSFFIHL